MVFVHAPGVQTQPKFRDFGYQNGIQTIFFVKLIVYKNDFKYAITRKFTVKNEF